MSEEYAFFSGILTLYEELPYSLETSRANPPVTRSSHSRLYPTFLQRIVRFVEFNLHATFSMVIILFYPETCRLVRLSEYEKL